jgi:hypothetical protein
MLIKDFTHCTSSWEGPTIDPKIWESLGWTITSVSIQIKLKDFSVYWHLYWLDWGFSY